MMTTQRCAGKKLQLKEGEQILGTTESVCPECLKRIPAQRVAVNDEVFLDKTCAEHGHFRTVIWRGTPSYASWRMPKLPSHPPVCATTVDRGCPFDCGLCPDHRQHSCCVLLEVTQRCNLSCPVCFASSCGNDRDPDLTTIDSWYRTLLASGGPYNIQLSGGEPTVRDDLPEIIECGRALGFSFFQLNTNGLRLADEPAYFRQLKNAGLSCVFLQFDGTDDSIYKAIRGAPLLERKKKAIDQCEDAGVGVVLVPTLVPGINTENIGDILSFGLSRMPAVRGVHFQPVSYFGRYPAAPSDADRITIPEIITNIERQTGGMMKVEHFSPPRAENAYCSFLGHFVRMEEGALMSWKKENQSCCCAPPTAGQSAQKAQQFVALKWSAPCGNANEAANRSSNPDRVNTSSMDAFLDRVDRFSFCVTGMAFQDAWTLDLERLRECFIHVVSLDKRIIPFCAYNLTDKQGRPLYRAKPGCQ